MVTRLSHADVVRMIQNCGSYVGLTLLSNPSGAANNSSPSSPLPNEPTLSPGESPTPPIHQQNINCVNNNGSSTITTTMVQPNSAATSPIPSTMPPTTTVTLSSATISSNTISALLNSSSNNNNNNNSNNHVQITHPQPVTESTQQEYQNNQIRTLQQMIESQNSYLKSNGHTLSESQRIEINRVIDNLRKKLSKLINNSLNNNTNNNGNDINRQSTDMDDTTIDTVFGMNNHEQFDHSHEHSIDANGGSIMIQSKSPPTKGSFLSRIPGTRGSGTSKRDSKIMNLATAGGILALPVMTGLGSSPSSSTSMGLHHGSSIPITLENVGHHSLRFARYLINSQSVPPHAMLFLVVTKHIFPGIVANTANSLITINNRSNDTVGLRQLINRWANQIVATWLTKESPLFFQEFPTEYFDSFDRQLPIFISTVAARESIGLAANPFEPFLERAREIVTKQLAEFQIITQAKPELLVTQAKMDLQATIEMLLLGGPSAIASTGSGSTLKLDIRDVDATFDQYISVAQINSVSTIAIITSLLTIGHYLFQFHTKHLLLSDASNYLALLNNQTNLLAGQSSSSLSSSTANTSNTSNNNSNNNTVLQNPVMKLSVDSTSTTSKKGNHKRNVSLPAQSKPSILNGSLLSEQPAMMSQAALSAAYPNGINEGGHYFIPMVEMISVKYCTGCLLTLWGDLNNYRCVKCLLLTHVWCLKSTSNANPCENIDQELQSASNHLNQSIHGGIQLRNAHSARESSRIIKSKRSKSDKKSSVIDMFTGKFRPTSTFITSQHDSSSPANINRSMSSLSSFDISSSSSSSDSEDFSVNINHSISNTSTNANNNQDNEPLLMQQSKVTSPSIIPSLGSIIPTGKVPLPIVNRSGSFNQRVSRLLFIMIFNLLNN